MDVVTGWTGRAACALQASLRMSNQEFAARLGIGLRTVADWHEKPDMRPRPNMQRILDTALAQAAAAARERFAELNGRSPAVSVRRDESDAAADTEHLTVAIAVVITERDVLLVCRREAEPSGITWQFPAGIVKPGASGAMIAVRETLAETSIHCSVRRSLGSRVHPLSGVNCEYFLCDYLIGEVENRDPLENVSATWAPRADVTRFISADRIFPPVLRVLEETNDAGRS
jgi:8-oxo-dGTP pyrophosphatase MutT (NUDIX family)